MTTYTNEDHLQVIIADAPHHVPGVPEDALALRELSTSTGPADVCIIDPNSEITIVECKLGSNAERRCLVIGPVLDYAAAIRQAGVDAFRRKWSRQSGPDLSELDEGSRDQLERNITDGRIHLCLAVDLIDADLRHLVEYLNLTTRDDVRVTALQLAYARHGTVESLSRPSAAASSLTPRSTPRTRRVSGPRNPSSTRSPHHMNAPSPSGSSDCSTSSTNDLDPTTICGSATTGQGGVFFHVYGLRFAPIQLWVNKVGQFMAYGNWCQ